MSAAFSRMWQVLSTTRSASSPSAAGHALGGEQFAHPLAVIDVHLAAEAFDAEGLGEVSHRRAPIASRRAPTEAAARRRSRRARAAGQRLAIVERRRADRAGARSPAACPLRPRMRSALAVPGSPPCQRDRVERVAIVDRDRADAHARRRRRDRVRAGSSGTAARRGRRRSCLRGTTPAAAARSSAAAIAATWPCASPRSARST